METNTDTVSLLREIRDLQREQLNEYKLVTARALEIQERSLAKQEQMRSLYRRVVAGGAVLIVILLIYLAYLSRLL